MLIDGEQKKEKEDKARQDWEERLKPLKEAEEKRLKEQEEITNG